MSSFLIFTCGDRSVLAARPATYEDLLMDIRTHFLVVSSVQNLIVLYQPADGNGTLTNNWVEVDPSAYGAIHNGAELFVNVVHPLTKEYILPMPGQLRSNRLPGKQVQQTDGLGNQIFSRQATGEQQVSTNKPKDSSHRHKHSMLSLELARPGGDAFASGWGAASGRLRRSAKLVPNVKDCKEAIGQTVGESNFYPDDEEEQEQAADNIPGLYQNAPAATSADWATGVANDDGDAFVSEARVLAGGGNDEADFADNITPAQTNGNLTNGELTNGNLTNGDLTNGYHVHDEVSQNPQHRDQNNEASDWSPPRPEYNGYGRPQNPRMAGYPPAQPNFKSFAGSRLRRDPAEVTFGSPQARVQGSTTGWTTMGRKKKTWTNKPLQEDHDDEVGQGSADNSLAGNQQNSWYDPSPPNGFASATGPGDDGRTFKHSNGRAVKDGTDKYRQISRAPSMHW
ncbi:hypothetical protein Daus18300_003208 [Diaporthe australafricana]|uniref:Uncharacterized protein n=1 Tax=Diaporthe australafricana TaxID=127596 RepID=A0ABR3XHM5_9PEZI